MKLKPISSFIFLIRHKRYSQLIVLKYSLNVIMKEIQLLYVIESPVFLKPDGINLYIIIIIKG